MKLIYVVVDGMGDLPIPQLGFRTPLEAAETPNMDFLAKNGKTGLMYTVKEGIAPESDVAVISILGYDPFEHGTGRGVLEAVGAGIAMNDGDLALRCNFATLGDEKKIIDRRVGRDLTTEEATELSKAANDLIELESYPADFEFRNTIGHRAVLVMRSRKDALSSRISNTDPAYSRMEGLGVAEKDAEMVLKKCEPIDDTGQAAKSAALVNEFTEKSHKIWGNHDLNIIRAAKGRLKANVVLSRDAGHIVPKFPSIQKKYGINLVALTDMPVERGISKLAGMRIAVIPPPSDNLKKDCETRIKKLKDLLPAYDGFFVHIKGPDEPGHDGDFDLKTQFISIIDKHFIGELLKIIDLEDSIVCVTADHSTPCLLKSHSDDPVPLLIAGNAIKGDNLSKFSEKSCSRGSLGLLKTGSELMPKLVCFLKH